MSEYQNYDDYNDPEEINEYDAIHGDPNKITVSKIIKKTITTTLKLIAISVFCILFWRILSSGDTKLAKTFIWNDATLEAKNFETFYYKRPDNYSDNGRFSASNVFYVPSLGQFQITVRYNKSTLEKIAEEYNLQETPSGEVFVYTLTDNLGNRYTEYEYLTDAKNLYQYRRVIFENVDMNATKEVDEDGQTVTKQFEELYLNVYYANDVLYSKPYATITIYDQKYYHEPLVMTEHPYDEEITNKLTPAIPYLVKEETDQTE